jgi:hypothetical protein
MTTSTGDRVMSLIKDVKEEVTVLPLDKKSLRKFGLLIGGIFIIISMLLYFNDAAELLFWILILFGSGLFISGLVFPEILRSIYIGWMIGAIVLGWFVSRIILAILFYLVLAPIGLLAKIVGKKFLDLKYDDKPSYWILKEKKQNIDYTKMY